MKQTKLNKIIPSLLCIAYIVLVVTSIFFKDLPHYNAYLYFIFGIIFLYYERSTFVFMFTGFLSLLLWMVSSLNGIRELYILLDVGVMFYVVASINFIEKSVLSYYTRFYLKCFFLLMLFLSVLNMLNPESYVSRDEFNIRYQGLFSGGNTSASMFAIFSIFVYEIEKSLLKVRKVSNNKIILWFLASLVVTYYAVSRTRTLLFVFPYWIYQFYMLYGKKAIVASLAILIIYGSSILILVQKYGRLEEDSSYMTRSVLYDLQLSGILDNYIIIPHGSHSATEMIRIYTDNDEYSAHNDFLMLTYDWGGLFIILLSYIIYRIKRLGIVNINLILILLGYSGFALHNLFLKPYVWIPLILLLILLKNDKDNEQLISHRQKI